MSVAFGRQGREAALPERAAGSGFEVPWSRLAKAGGAIAVLAIGAYAVLADQVAIATDNAVVSAYSVALRSPIDGIVSGEGLRIGEPVARGAVLADIANNRVDDQRLIDLREHLVAARAHIAALDAQHATLTAIGADLERRSQAYNSSSEARLVGSLSEAEHTLASLNARKAQAASNLSRRTQLAQTGSASASDFDKARADYDAAANDALAQAGRLETLRAQFNAIKIGVVSEPGSNDVAYSRQRADEIAIRLSDVEQARAAARADVQETSARLDSEQARIAKLVDAPMTAPLAGIVWKINASPGERVGVGDAIAEVVDCSTAFIIATVPQDRVPEIDDGGEVQFRLSGETIVRHGRVRAVTGNATHADRNLAAVPFEQKESVATLRIDMDPNDRPPNDGACFVGRTARVLIPSAGPGFVERLKSHFR